MASIKDVFRNLNPRHKKLAVVTLIVVAFLAIIFIGYSFREEVEPPVAIEKGRKITLDERLLEKAYSESVRKELARRRQELDDIKVMLDDLKKAGSKEKESADKEPVPRFNPDKRPPEEGPSFPKPPERSSPSRIQRDIGARRPQAVPPEALEKPQPIGGIESLSIAANSEPKAVEKKKHTVYLPPSFMEATLLTGFSAATMQSAKTYEKPLLLRVRDIAVLPNDVKTNLKGCFIIASAYGDLSDERAHARLVNLTCIGRSGESVIDASVKGFVVDADGKIGLAGNVVTRAGALLGRSIVAGFFGGIGEAFRASTSTQSISALGTTQAMDSDKLLEAGVGGGLGEGFDSLQDFYLEMARQTFPIIEVGAVKNVTVVIEQGVELEIKDFCIGGFEGCERKDGR